MLLSLVYFALVFTQGVVDFLELKEARQVSEFKEIGVGKGSTVVPPKLISTWICEIIGL